MLVPLTFHYPIAYDQKDQRLSVVTDAGACMHIPVIRVSGVSLGDCECDDAVIRVGYIQLHMRSMHRLQHAAVK